VSEDRERCPACGLIRATTAEHVEADTVPSAPLLSRCWQDDADDCLDFSGRDYWTLVRELRARAEQAERKLEAVTRGGEA
jgi:hypothetical protein